LPDIALRHFTPLIFARWLCHSRCFASPPAWFFDAAADYDIFYAIFAADACYAAMSGSSRRCRFFTPPMIFLRQMLSRLCRRYAAD